MIELCGRWLRSPIANLSRSGALFRTPESLERGTIVTANFKVDDMPDRFTATGRVVYAHREVVALMFLEDPIGLHSLIRSLAA